MADDFPKDLPSVAKEDPSKPFTKRDQTAVNDAAANAMPPLEGPPIGKTVQVEKEGGIKLTIKYN